MRAWRLLTFAASLSLLGCPNPFGPPPPSDGGTPPGTGCPLSPDEHEFWKTLALEYEDCLTSKSTSSCRQGIESREWWPLSDAAAIGQELHGTIASGGSLFSSPERAPDGDLCMSHDDLDWNFNVTPDPVDSSILQPANFVGDEDHPDGGAVESEWELMYVDPTFIAKPADAGASYQGWPLPNIDMQVGDRVALRGAGVLDCGHSPNRGELHPPYLAVWGGLRGDAGVIYVRATAQPTRPADFRSLPDPPLPSEVLADDFPLPAVDGGNWSLLIDTSVDWFLDNPSVVQDQGCNLANGIDVTTLQGPAFDSALASPAGHLVAASQPNLAASFFNIATELNGSALHVTVTPLKRPHQAVLGASIRATWVCLADGGC